MISHIYKIGAMEDLSLTSCISQLRKELEERKLDHKHIQEQEERKLDHKHIQEQEERKLGHIPIQVRS